MNFPAGPLDAGIQGLLREAYTAVSSGDPTQALRLVLAALHATGGQAAAAPALNRVLTHLTANNQSNALQELTELFARAASVRCEEPSTPSQAQPQGPPAAPPAWRDATAAAAGGSDSMSCSADDAPSASPSASHSMDTEGTGGGRLGGAPPPAGWWAGGGSGGDRRAAGGGGGRGGGCGQEATSAWVGPGSLGPQPQAPILSETGREGFMDCALADGSSYVCGRCRGVVLFSRRLQHEQFWCQGGGGAGARGGGSGGEGVEEKDLEE